MYSALAPVEPRWSWAMSRPTQQLFRQMGPMGRSRRRIRKRRAQAGAALDAGARAAPIASGGAVMGFRSECFWSTCNLAEDGARRRGAEATRRLQDRVASRRT